LITGAGKSASLRFLEFFTFNIRNPNSRAAYTRSAAAFLRWCETRGGFTGLSQVQPVHVAAYIEELLSDAGIETAIGCHTFRATGITDYVRNGGRVEIAKRMAGHSNAKTTGLYDRRNDEVSLDEVERIGI